MRHEFETTLEIGGSILPALLGYEYDPDDGRPLIDAVEVARVDRYGKRTVLDVIGLLDEWQLMVFEGQILAEDEAAGADAAIDDYELDLAYRRAA